jgi:hypothetical protein
LQFRSGFLRQTDIAIPDRDRSARLQKAIDDRATNTLRTAGDHGVARTQIDLVSHVGLPPKKLANWVPRGE